MPATFDSKQEGPGPVNLDSPESLSSLGDSAVIEAVYRSYGDYIYSVVRSKILSSGLSADDIDDCFSHAVMKLAENGCGRVRQFSGKSSFKTYLTVLCRNIAVDYIRSEIRKGGRTAPIESANGDAAAGAAASERDLFRDNAEAKYIRNERDSLITQAAGIVRRQIEGLDDCERLVFKLRSEDGKTYREINSFLGIDNSAYCYSKALNSIRDAVDSRLRHTIEELLAEM